MKKFDISAMDKHLTSQPQFSFKKKASVNSVRPLVKDLLALHKAAAKTSEKASAEILLAARATADESGEACEDLFEMFGV